MELDRLPDEAVERVLGAAGREAAPAISLVSKRWRRLVFQAEFLWRQLHLDPGKEVRLQRLHALPRFVQDKLLMWEAEHRIVIEHLATREQQLDGWLDRKQRLLRRVGGHVRIFGLQDATALLQPATLAGLLAQLRPERLWELRLACKALAPAALAAVPRLSGLTRLELSAQERELPEELLAVLGALPLLRDLRCQAAGLPTGTVACVSEHLVQLTRLSLVVNRFSDALQPLTALAQLQLLTLREDSFQLPATSAQLPQTLVLPAPAAHWPRLRSFVISRSRGSWEIDFWRVGRASYAAHALSASDQLVFMAPRDSATLHIHDAVGLSPLLVESLIPQGIDPQAPALTALHLSNVAAPPGGLAPTHVRRWHVLGALRNLSVRGTDCSALSWGARLLAAMLAQAPAVDAVALVSCQLAEVPPALAACTGLTSLLLPSNELSDLPAGAWLAGLHTLDLSSNRLASLPPALTAATALTSLHLGSNQLTDLPTGGWLPGLRALDLSGNRLARLPPALSAATALASLCLFDNRGLLLSPADVQLLEALPLAHESMRQLPKEPTPVDRFVAAALFWLDKLSFLLCFLLATVVGVGAGTVWLWAPILSRYVW